MQMPRVDRLRAARPAASQTKGPALDVRPAPEFQRALATVGGGLALLIGWQLLAQSTHRAIVASPAETLIALEGLWVSGELARALQVTLVRLLVALAAGGTLGLSLGLAAGFSPLLRAFLEPLRWVLMALPAVFIAVLGMLWFGLGDRQVIFLVTVVISPVMYVNTLAGVLALDRQLLEMGRLYRFSRGQLLARIVLPGISPQVIAGLRLAAGIGVRAVVMAELLGAFDGVGRGFNNAWTFLKTPEMFAWMLVSLGMMAALEFAVLLPVGRLLLRWRQA